jgi:hypothetical protein
MVPSPQAHQAVLADAARALLVEAARAGVTFVGVAKEMAGADTAGTGSAEEPSPSSRKGRGRGRGSRAVKEKAAASERSEPDPARIEAVAEALGSAIVTPLRQRLPSGQTPDASDMVGAAYREWRGERIEGLAGDHALYAFSIGVLAGAGPDVPVRWTPGADGALCADCEDNSLAEDVVSGGNFPTGHAAPPAHPGCRCVVAPSAT